MTLIDRLSKLVAPDREVDAEICIALQYVTAKGATDIRRDTDEEFKDEWLDFEVDGELWTEKTPELTASVDAAIALAERVFPGTEYEFTNLYNIVRVTIELNGEFGGFHGEHVNSLPIAICIALLRAKDASKL